MTAILKIIEIIIMFAFLLPGLFILLITLANPKISKYNKFKKIKSLIFIIILSFSLLLTFSIIISDSTDLYKNMNFAPFKHMYIIFISCIKTYIDLFEIVSMTMFINIIFRYIFKKFKSNKIYYYIVNENIIYLHFSLEEIIMYFNLWLETKIFIKYFNKDILISKIAYEEYLDKLEMKGQYVK